MSGMDKTRLPTLDVKKPRRLRGTPAEGFVRKVTFLGIVWTLAVGSAYVFCLDGPMMKFKQWGKQLDGVVGSLKVFKLKVPEEDMVSESAKKENKSS